MATEHIAADYPIHDIVERLLHASGQWVVAASVDCGEPNSKCSKSSSVSLHHDDITGGVVRGLVSGATPSSTDCYRRHRLPFVYPDLDLQVDAQTSATATGNRKDSSNATAVVAPGVKDKVDVRTISKTIFNEASRLKNDAAGWDQKLQELELDLDLKKRQQDFEAMAKDLDECLVVLRAAADRLAPDAEARETFRKQEGALREVASRAEVHPDPTVRKTAAYFQRKTTELRALNRSVEETRIELTTQIDRLEAQLAFNAGAGQMNELVRAGWDIVNGIQAIAANAQQFANDLASIGRTPAATAQPAETPAEATKRPAAVVKPADSTAHGTAP